MFAAYAVLALLGLLFLLTGLMDYSVGISSKATTLIHTLALAPAAALLIILTLRERERPERVFLLISVPVMLGFALLFPPNQIPDELWHIYRVFSINNPGSAMVVPAALDVEIVPKDYAGLQEVLQMPFSWSETIALDRDMSSYLTHLYLIPGLVVKLCSALDIHPYIALYLARFTNITLFSVAGYWIIKIMPMAKILTCVYLLNPLLLQQEASCSADAVTNILTLLFIATLVNIRFKNDVKPHHIAILIVLFALTALSKYAYALLVFLFLLLVPKISSKRKRNLIYSCAAICTLAAAVFIALFMSSASYQDTLDLIRSPGELVWVMKNTFIEMTPHWIEQFLGSALGTLSVYPWRPCLLAYALVLCFSLVFNMGEEASFTRIEKISLVVLVAFITAAIILVFRNWTLTVDLRSDIIMGFQGRYMLPYLILLFLCFSTPRASLVRKNCLLVYSGIMLFIYAFDVIAIVGAFA